MVYLQWLKGTTLVPLLAALDDAQKEAFLTTLATELRTAYPPDPDAVTLFPFRRVFLLVGV